ncbi:MAG TPA: ABC transporter permease [Sphingomicrobium sp.]|nr:ABC transporter permease [Sphingomicrobium sp.]
MTHLLRSAFVIGRRDFTATVFSKAFIFFLIGPLFPVLLGGLFGGIGARVASQTEQPTVAAIVSSEDFAKLEAARRQLSDAFGGRPVLDLVRVAPEPDFERQKRAILDSKAHPVVAVLTGGLDRPHLTGAVDWDGTTSGQVALLISAARAPQETEQPLAVTRTERSTASDSRSRAITAQVGQMLLFFLTILLAGMTLSQLIEEKSNKVIEVLAAAVPIESIFVGKLFAMLATSIVGIVVWVSAGVAAVAMFTAGGTAAFPEPAVGTAMFMLLTVVYFGMNYLLLGSVFLSIGAQASTVREVQTLSMPVTVAQVLIFGFASLAVGSNNSPMGIAAALFPLSSPLAMVARAAERPELWPHLIAILWQALWVGLIILAAARIFRRTVLKSGPVKRRWWRRAAA